MLAMTREVRRACAFGEADYGIVPSDRYDACSFWFRTSQRTIIMDAVDVRI
jgi:hypothetical protein